MLDRWARTRRRQLSEQLLPLREILPPVPRKGWVRTIREAYGLELKTFGGILGMTRQGASRLEAAEPSGSITVRRLRAAADALDCDLAVVLIPREPLETNLRNRTLALARREAHKVDHTMALEGQNLDQERLQKAIKDVSEDDDGGERPSSVEALRHEGLPG